MKAGFVFLCIALGSLGFAVYLGADTRLETIKAEREARAAIKAKAKKRESDIRGAEQVESQAVGDATTKADEADFLTSLNKRQGGTDLQAIEKALANQQISLTPMERRVKDSPVVGRLAEVHPDLGFAVIDAGKDQNLQPGMKLAVRRDYHLVGRLVIGDTVEEVQSVANIVPDSIPTGIKLRQGDAVIPWAAKER